MTVLQDIAKLRDVHGWTWTRVGSHYGTSEREVRRWVAEQEAPDGLAPPLVLNWGTAMVVNDTQFPFFDPALWEVTCQIARDAEVDRLIWDGDMLDFPQLSRFEHNPYKLKTAKEDVREFHRLVRDPFVKEVPTLTQEDWNDGNHEFRYEKYVEANASAVGEFPAARDFMELPDSVRWRRYGKAVGTWLGPDLLVAHGWMARKHSGYSAKGSLDDTGCSVIVGHTHRCGMHALTDTQGPKVAYEVGHMCDPEHLPKAVEGHQNWQQVAGTLVRYERDGNAFSVDMNMVTRGGRVLVNDREYRIDRSAK